jgi:hypothetical protein
VENTIGIVEPLQVVVPLVAQEASGGRVVGISRVFGYDAFFHCANDAAAIRAVAGTGGLDHISHD